MQNNNNNKVLCTKNILPFLGGIFKVPLQCRASHPLAPQEIGSALHRKHLLLENHLLN